MKNLYRSFLEFRRSIQRVICWIPIIYKDRDWDHAYIIDILVYKLERMRDCILRNAIIEDAQKVADEIDECVRRLKATIDTNWADKERDAFHAKYNLSEASIIDFFGFLDANPKIKKEFNAINKRGYKAEEKQFQEAFNYLRDHIRNWWD